MHLTETWNSRLKPEENSAKEQTHYSMSVCTVCHCEVRDTQTHQWSAGFCLTDAVHLWFHLDKLNIICSESIVSQETLRRISDTVQSRNDHADSSRGYRCGDQSTGCGEGLLFFLSFMFLHTHTHTLIQCQIINIHSSPQMLLDVNYKMVSGSAGKEQKRYCNFW